MGPQMQEIKEYEETVPHNFQQPNKSQQMLSQDGTVYNRSAQVPHVPCICRSSFGADKHHKQVPTSSEMWKAGQAFQKLWDATLLLNYEFYPDRRVYTSDLAGQVLAGVVELE